MSTGLQAIASSYGDKLRSRSNRRRGYSPVGFGDFCRNILKLDHSPVMAAIVAASEGAPVTLDDESSMAVFGCTADKLPRSARRVVGIRAGGRAGKTSRLLAPKALHCAWTVPLPNLRRGEYARALITAPDMDFAKQVINYCRGYIEDSPLLRSHAIGVDEDDDGEVGTVERIGLRRPDGHLVEIAIKAASGKGKTGRSRTLVFAGFDEAAFFNAGESRSGGAYVVDEDELFGAVIQRVEPGGQVWLVSSPWVEHFGFLEKLIDANLGNHRDALVATAGTRKLNPNWDPNYEIEGPMRRNTPEKAMREIDAIPLPSGTKQFFPEDAIKLSFGTAHRTADLDPAPHLTHWAGVDMGFRKNSSALTIARVDGSRVRVASKIERRPDRGTSLKPSEIVRDFAYQCMRYGVRRMRGDLEYVESSHEELAKLARAMRSPEHADKETRDWVEKVKRDPFACRSPVPSYEEWAKTPLNNEEMYTEFRRRMQEGLVDLVWDERLYEQLQKTTYKPGSGGVIKIVLPNIGWAHGDLLETTAIACTLADLSYQSGITPHVVAATGHGDFAAPDNRYAGADSSLYGDERGY